jgi:hypothetical protein
VGEGVGLGAAQSGNLNEPMRVVHTGGEVLPSPSVSKYSVVYQKVQPSDGSTVIEL